MKPCSKCKQEKDLSEFSRDSRAKDGLCYQCKVCKAKEDKGYYLSNQTEKCNYQRGYRQLHLEGIAEKQVVYRRTPSAVASHDKSSIKYSQSSKGRAFQQRDRDKFPQEIKARRAVFNAIKAGILIRPSTCESCNEKKFVQGHHESYKEIHWLDVAWLCITCHRELHRDFVKIL